MTLTASLPERLNEGRKTFFWALKAERGLLGINLVACLLLFPMMTAMQLSHVREGVQGQKITWYNYDFSNALRMQGSAAALLELFVILILIGTLFGYMHDRRALDLLHAVPVGRVPLLLGRWGAALLTVLLPLFVGCAGNDIVVAANGLQAGGTLRLFLRLAVPLVAALSFSIFVCVCCGNTFNTILSILIINLAWPVLFWIGSALLCNTLPGFVDLNIGGNSTLYATQPLYTLLSPAGAILSAAFTMPPVMGAAYWVWWSVCSVVLLATATVLYCRRKSESAENSFAFAAPKLVIQFLVSAAAALLMGMIFGSTYPDMCLFGVILGGVLTFVLLEVVYSRGFRNFKKMLLPFGVFAAVGAVVILCVSFDVFGFSAQVPQAADVVSAEIGGRGYVNNFSTNVHMVDGYPVGTSHMALCKIHKADEIAELVKEHKIITDSFSSACKPYSFGTVKRFEYNMTITYHLKNGKTMRREYFVGTTPQTGKAIQKIQSLSGFKNGIYVVNLLEPEMIQAVSVDGNEQAVQKSLSVSEALELQKAIQADEDQLKPYVNLYTGKDMGDADVHVNLVTPKSGVTPKAGSELAQVLGTDETVWFDNLYYPLPQEAVHTRAFLKEKGMLK